MGILYPIGYFLLLVLYCIGGAPVLACSFDSNLFLPMLIKPDSWCYDTFMHVGIKLVLKVVAVKTFILSCLVFPFSPPSNWPCAWMLSLKFFGSCTNDDYFFLSVFRNNYLKLQRTASNGHFVICEQIRLLALFTNSAFMFIHQY